jgi:hypothetical protein
MRLLKLVPLLALPSLFLGATCVTHIEQKGATGPWIGEVTNSGPDVLMHANIIGTILDAEGKTVGPLMALNACPAVILPGQKGYFASLPTPTTDRTGFVQPYHLSPLTVRSYGPDFRAVTGVTFHVLQVYPERKAILVEARNDSPHTYVSFNVCAVNIAPSGEARGISIQVPFRSVVFKPGDVMQFTIGFDPPLDGTFLFSAAAPNTKYDTVVSSPPFDYTSKVVQTDNGRELRVVGEVTNTSQNDLESTWVMAYLVSSPTVRTCGFAGSVRMGSSCPVEGTGVIPAGKKALFTFILPLDDDDTTEVKVEGIGGDTSRSTHSPIAVRNVSRQRTGSGQVRVSATLSNPTDSGMRVDSLCFVLRDINGKPVGGQCERTWIEPHGSIHVSKELTPLDRGRVASADVVAYGYPGPDTPPVFPPS